MQHDSGASAIPQYSLSKIVLVWALAAVPMGVLGWVVAPALARGAANQGLTRLAVLAVGLVWQFVLVVILLRAETRDLSWSSICQRLWLQPPTSPRTGMIDRRLWWWLIPLILLTAAAEMLLDGPLSKFWVSLIPAFAEPRAFSMAGFLDTPEARAQLVGAWGFLVLYVVQAFFNTVIGEELLFRGLLLPRMQGSFGKWDWVANGILHGIYHLHQPWGMLSSAFQAMFLVAYPTRRFKSAWFGIIVHSGQSIYFTILLLGLVLGLA